MSDWFGRSVNAVASGLGRGPYNFTRGYGSSSYRPYGGYAGGYGYGSQGVPGFGSYGARNPHAYANTFGNPITRYSQWAQADILKQLQGLPADTSGNVGNVGSADFSGVEQWANAINQAAIKTGVPASLIKAVMMVESGGQNLPINDSNAVGPMQVTTNNWGGLGYNLYDPVQNIMAGATILKQMYDLNPSGGWQYAVRAYFAGPGGAYSGNRDSFGTDPDTYWGRVNAYWQALNSRAGDVTAGFGGAPGQTGGGPASIANLFAPGTQAPISQDFGYSDFAAANPDLYSYETAYGLDGKSHTGIDIAVPAGTTYYAPMGGTVLCAGTGVGQDSGGGTCDAFQDRDEGSPAGSGRVEVMLDNGTVLIYGHSRSSLLQPGARFTAGQAIGISGSENGAHVHLEARVKDPITPSGWRIVDPRTVLGWGAGGNFGGSATPVGGGFGGNWWQRQGTVDDLLSSLFGGG